MNKGCGGKQPMLRNRWFDQRGTRITQPINFLNDKIQWVQKEIQKVLEERKLGPVKGLYISCPNVIT